MVPGIDPKIDFVFKKTFGGDASDAVLPSLIDAVRQRVSSHRVTAIEVLNPFSDTMKLDEKLAILDIKARDESGQWYNLEMQMLAVAALSKRFLFYWAKIYSQQLVEGDNYRDLRPTISICFVNEVVFKDRPDEYHTVFKLKSEDGQVCLTDDLEIHVIELPKFNKTLAELQEPLDLWLYFLKNGEELDADQLPEPLNTEPIRKAMEVLKKMSQNTIEREIYEGRLKARRDQRAWEQDMEARLLELQAQQSKLNAQQLELNARHSELNARHLELNAQQLDLQALRSDVSRWHERYDKAARERDKAARERDEAARERDEAARERDEVQKLVFVRQVQLCERLLNRAPSDAASLVQRSLEELREAAEQLEAELKTGTSGS